MLPCVTVLGGTFAKIVSKMLLNFESSDHGRVFFLFVVFFEAVEVLPNILFSPFYNHIPSHPLPPPPKCCSCVPARPQRSRTSTSCLSRHFKRVQTFFWIIKPNLGRFKLPCRSEKHAEYF